MGQRIPHTESPLETRQAFQQAERRARVILSGALDYILVGQGIGTAPTWQVLSSAIDHGGLGGLTGDDHAQYHTDARGDARYYTQTLLNAGQLDTIYFQESEFLNSSAGAGDAGKPIKLDAAGHIDATMINDADIDHGTIGGLAGDDHAQYHNDTRGDARYYTQTLLNAGQLDTQYYQESEFLNSSAGAGDAGKPVKLDAAGHIDASMINDGDVDHGSIGGLAGDDHTIYSLADGSRDLTGNWSIDAGITIDGRDLSVDGAKLDLIEAQADVTDATNVAAAGAAMSGGAFHDGFSDFVSAEHVSLPNTITNVLSDHTIVTHKTMGLHQTIEATNNNAGTISKCYAVFADDNDDVDLANALSDADSRVIGLVADTSIASGSSGTIRTDGILTATPEQWDTCGAGSGAGLVAGTKYWLGATVGTLTSTKPALPTQFSVVVGIALSTTDMLVLPQKVSEADGVVEQITSDLTIYVDTGGNDITGIGDSGDPLATLAGALSFLGPKLISSTATVTIQIADGTYTAGSATDIAHINGDRINIVGENTHDKTLSSIQSSSGSAGAWSIVLNLNSVADIVADDFLLVPGSVTGGTAPATLWGCWKITNVDSGNTRITVASTGRHATPPSGAVAGTVTVVKTILEYSGVNGLVFAGGALLGLIDKVVLLGTGVEYGIWLQAMSDCNATGGAFGISNFSFGAQVSLKSVLRINSGIISSSAGRNVSIQDGSLQANAAVFSGCVGQSVRASQANVTMQGAFVSGNAAGVLAQTQSSVIFGASGEARYNTGIAVKAQYNSYMYTASSSFSSNGTNASPAFNTLGNVESYITN